MRWKMPVDLFFICETCRSGSASSRTSAGMSTNKALGRLRTSPALRTGGDRFGTGRDAGHSQLYKCSAVRLGRPESQYDPIPLVERFVLQPRLLKKVITSCFIENDLIPDRDFELREIRGIFNPIHFSFETPLHRAEPVDDSVFHILNFREHFPLFHELTIRNAAVFRYQVFLSGKPPNGVTVG